MAVWRYLGDLIGIPKTIPFRDEQEALRFFEIGGTRDQFSGVLAVPTFDEVGVSYAVPEHVYNEQSIKWLWQDISAMLPRQALTRNRF